MPFSLFSLDSQVMRKLLILLGLCLFSTAFAGSGEELNLIFEDRMLTLNFEAQPELLQQSAQHFLRIGEDRIHIDMGDNLPVEDGLFTIETDFYTTISPQKLEEFLKSTSIIRDKKEKRSVEILIEDKEIVFDGTPRDGFEIELDRLIELMNEALQTDLRFVHVPAEKIFSDVVVHPDLAEKGIQEIIAVGESNFTGSSESRRQNIIAGAQKFNGVVIPRGGIFSFNKILESVEEEDGFVRELVIKGDKTEKELGGGVCQVSTTAFRAALSGGLAIRQRRNHSYAVPYYKPYGLDAAIYIGALDMSFRNDTPGSMLIQTFTEGDNLFFVFYGTDDGRKVSLSGPYISDYKEAPAAIVYESEDLPFGEIQEIGEAHDGFKAEWIRRIENNGKVKNSYFKSEYRAWPAKQLKGVSYNQNVR